MTRFDIVPFSCAGRVKLDLTKEDIINTIGQPSDRLPEKDCYRTDGIFFSISYDKNDRAEYIEYSNPEDEKIKVLFQGIDIFGTPAEDLINQITMQTGHKYDKDDGEIPYSYIFPDFELSFWRPIVPDDDEDEDGRYFMTVGIGIKGYYTDK